MFKDFQQINKEQWLNKVEKDLKGKPIESLNWEMNGSCYSPFYHAVDVKKMKPLLTNGKEDNAWEIGDRIIVKDYKKANQQALESLDKGANALCFEFSNPPTFDDFCLLSEDIHYDWISTYFISSKKENETLVSNFIKVLQLKKQDVTSINCSFLLSEFPFSKLKEWQTAIPKAQFLTIQSIPQFHGNDEVVKELAWCLDNGNKMLLNINEQQLDLKAFVASFQFSITLGNNYFQNIAKIRALKLLWNQVLNAWDNSISANPFINVFLTDETQTQDEHQNKIIATTQAMSAIIGGANRLFIYPSDSFKTTNGTSFSRRIALNLHHLLKEESYLDKVIDPSAGSYFIEHLTNDLAGRTWTLFQQQTS